MARLVVALAFSLCLLSGLSFGQTSVEDLKDAELGPLGVLPSDLLSKINQLALILQQNMNDGKLNDIQIQRELYDGNLAGVIKELGPEADRLLDDIRASFQANHNEESLSLMLHMLMNSTLGLPLQ